MDNLRVGTPETIQELPWRRHLEPILTMLQRNEEENPIRIGRSPDCEKVKVRTFLPFFYLWRTLGTPAIKFIVCLISYHVQIT